MSMASFDPADGPPRLDVTALEALFDPSCAVAAAVPALCDGLLYPEERACVAQAVDKRRAEFGTARVVARRVLSRLGVGPLPLVPRADRSPTWPPGIVGSITHTGGYCAVVAANDRTHLSLGVDAEQDKALAVELIQAICTPRERARLSERDAIVYFAAKEAFYKCQYPLTRQYLGFHDVELDLELASGRFAARIIKPDHDEPSWLRQLRGRFTRVDGLVLCGVSYRR